VQNRVPENIVDGNYFLIRRSIARLKLRSTIHGLRRSCLYLSHKWNIYNIHERFRGILPSQFEVNFVSLLRTRIRVDFTLHTRWGRERGGFRWMPTFMREILRICGKKSISAGSLAKESTLNSLSSREDSVYPLASHHSDDRAQLPPALPIFLHPPSNHILSSSLIHSPNLPPGRGAIRRDRCALARNTRS